MLQRANLRPLLRVEIVARVAVAMMRSVVIPSLSALAIEAIGELQATVASGR